MQRYNETEINAAVLYHGAIQCLRLVSTAPENLGIILLQYLYKRMGGSFVGQT